MPEYQKQPTVGYVSLWSLAKKKETQPDVGGSISILVSELQKLEVKTNFKGEEVYEFNVSVWENLEKKNDSSPDFTGKLQERKNTREEEDKPAKPSFSKKGLGKFS